MAILFLEYSCCCCCCAITITISSRFLLYATYTGNNYHCLCMFGIESGFGLIFLMFWPESGIPAQPTKPACPTLAPPPPRKDVIGFIRFTGVNLRTRRCAGRGQKRGKPPLHPMLTPNYGQPICLYGTLIITMNGRTYNLSGTHI
jgi:hypothetical protein